MTPPPHGMSNPGMGESWTAFATKTNRQDPLATTSPKPMTPLLARLRTAPRCHDFALLFVAVCGLVVPAVRGQDATPFPKVERGPVDLHKDKTLYVVPYAHLDTQWRWSYPQVIREFIADTLHRNFELIDKYPNYVFNFSGSRRYEMMHEYYPEDWERLKGYIKAGRWFPCGSSVDEDDANVPGLESMVRHVLYGNHYFRREFGVASEEFMLPDCFGFPACLPTVLSHCGIRGFSTQKLTWHSAVGIPFKIGEWIGPDGSALPVALDPGSYGGGVRSDLSQDATWLTRIDRTGAESGIFADYHYYGTGDRGGSPKEASVQWMEKSVAGTGPLRVLSANAQQMFLDLPADAAAKLPRYQGDLLLIEHSAGSLSSQAYMKRWNRKNEYLADAAERAAVAAAWLGSAPYPSKKLYDSWDLTLGSQMHDMLPGTSLPKAYEYCWNDDLLSANGFAAVASDSVGAVAGELDTRTHDGGTAVVVYNPLSVAREDVVEGSLPAADPDVAIQVTGPDGKQTPAQVLRVVDGVAHFLFLANVPPLSFTTFEVIASRKSADADKPANALRATGRTLENARYRVTVDDAGDVASIFDKAVSRELLAAPIRLEFHYEKPVSFPAWNMDWTDRQKPARGVVGGPASVRVVEDGPVRVALEIERRAEGSRFVSRVSLAAGGAGEAVEFHDQIDWRTPETSLKASFPLTAADPLAAYDDKVGVVQRGNNEPTKYEVPQHEWLDLTDAGGAYGVSVLNDCKYGSDKPDDHTVRLTLLYTPGVRSDYQDQASQDFGRHDMAYAVAGHPGDWRTGGTVARAHRLNQPLRAFSSPGHPGKLGRSFSLASVDNPQVEIVAIKKAEDSDETVVRLRELAGQAAQPVQVRFAAPVLSVREVDGQERPLNRAKAGENLRDGQIAARMEPYSLRSFAVKLGAPPVSAAPPAFLPVALAYDTDAVSTRANHADGGFDGEGRTYPADTLPSQIVSESVAFQTGPTADGQKNALACRGQTVALPPGDYDRIELLAAADGDKTVQFQVLPGGKPTTTVVQDWGGYIGQWDNRLWKGQVPELAYSWDNDLDGLVPGYVKPARVAWFCSHRHERGGVGVYQYCYLFKYGFDVPKGATSLVLPDAPGVRVFAATMVRNGHAAVQPLQPLFDDLADHRADAATGFQPAPGKYGDTVMVTCAAPLYGQVGHLRYTLDGSEPAASSPAWTGPVAIHANATLRTRMFLAGTGGPVTTVSYEIDDRTAPALRSARADTVAPTVSATFSEPLEKTAAETVANYRLEPPRELRSAKLSEDGTGVLLTLAAPLPPGSKTRLTVSGVRDRSPAGNAGGQLQCDVALAEPAYSLPETVVCDGQWSRTVAVDGLPLGESAPWTINCFVRPEGQPGNRTLIVGFGDTEDGEGSNRYLSKFANGIHFSSNNPDAETRTALHPGQWQMLTATYDGKTLKLYSDAVEIGSSTLDLHPAKGVVNLAPLEPWDHKRRFMGKISQLTIWKEALPPSSLGVLLQSVPGAAD